MTSCSKLVSKSKTESFDVFFVFFVVSHKNAEDKYRIAFVGENDLNRKFLAGRQVPCSTQRNEERCLGIIKLRKRRIMDIVYYSTACGSASNCLIHSEKD